MGDDFVCNNLYEFSPNFFPKYGNESHLFYIVIASISGFYTMISLYFFCKSKKYWFIKENTHRRKTSAITATTYSSKSSVSVSHSAASSNWMSSDYNPSNYYRFHDPLLNNDTNSVTYYNHLNTHNNNNNNNNNNNGNDNKYYYQISKLFKISKIHISFYKTFAIVSFLTIVNIIIACILFSKYFIIGDMPIGLFLFFVCCVFLFWEKNKNCEIAYLFLFCHLLFVCVWLCRLSSFVVFGSQTQIKKLFRFFCLLFLCVLVEFNAIHTCITKQKTLSTINIVL